MINNTKIGGGNNKLPLLICIVFLLLLSNIMFNSLAFAKGPQITLGTIKNQNSPEGRFVDLVYTEAFKRLGIAFIYKQLPAQRSSFMSDSGGIDGELSRIYSYNEVHPNLIRVEELHWRSEFLAVATNSTIKLDGWESLAKTKYKVTYKRGIKGCDINLPNVVRPENIEKVENNFQGFRKLLAGWADIFIGAAMGIVGDLELDEFKNSGLRIVGVMDEFTSHAFLHKKHKELVPKLAAVLKEMKKEGLVEEYWNIAKLKKYIKNSSRSPDPSKRLHKLDP